MKTGRSCLKNIYLMLVLLWPQYIRRGTFFVSRKGTFSNALLFLPGEMSVQVLDRWKYFETKQTFFLHDECSASRPVKVLRSQTNTFGRESCLIFCKVPSIEMPIVSLHVTSQEEEWWGSSAPCSPPSHPNANENVTFNLSGLAHKTS